MNQFKKLKAASPYRAIFRARVPDPGECVVRAIDWESGRADITNGSFSYHPEIAELYIWRKPDPTDPLMKLRDFLQPDDIKLATPMELMDELYKRVRLAHDIAQVENGTSWDYCKVAAIDWLNKTPRWIPIHRDAYWYQMGCVPPHFQRSGITMTGEAYSGAWHLTLLARDEDSFWCCLLKKSMVVEPSVIDRIPFADIPMLGVPEKKEVEL